MYNNKKTPVACATEAPYQLLTKVRFLLKLRAKLIPQTWQLSSSSKIWQKFSHSS